MNKSRKAGQGPEMFADHDEIVEVDEEQWKHAQGQVLRTRSASSCTVLAVYNPGSHSGYLGHFISPSSDARQRFNTMIREIQKNEPHLDELDIWVGGAAVIERDLDDTDRRTLAEMRESDKRCVLERLRGLDIPEDAISQHWLGVDEEIDQLELDCTTGQLKFTVRPLAEED